MGKDWFEMMKLGNGAKYLAVAATLAVVPACGNNSEDGQVPTTGNVPTSLVTTTTQGVDIGNPDQPQVPAVAFAGNSAYIECLNADADEPLLFSVLTGEDGKVLLNLGPQFHFVGDTAPEYVKAQLSQDAFSGVVEIQPDTDRFIIAFEDGNGGDLHFAISVSPDRTVVAGLLGSNDLNNVYSDLSDQSISGYTSVAYTVGSSPLTQVWAKGAGDKDFKPVAPDLLSPVEGFEAIGLSLGSKPLDQPGTSTAIAIREPALANSSVTCFAQAGREL